MRPRLEVMRRAEALGKYAVPPEVYALDLKRANEREKVLDRIFRTGLADAIEHDTRTPEWELSAAQADALAEFAWEEGHSDGYGNSEAIAIAERLVDALRARAR